MARDTIVRSGLEIPTVHDHKACLGLLLATSRSLPEFQPIQPCIQIMMISHKHGTMTGSTTAHADVQRLTLSISPPSSLSFEISPSSSTSPFPFSSFVSSWSKGN